jgi:hypothetical protein
MQPGRSKSVKVPSNAYAGLDQYSDRDIEDSQHRQPAMPMRGRTGTVAVKKNKKLDDNDEEEYHSRNTG